MSAMTSGEAPVLRIITIVMLTTATTAMLLLSMLTNATFGYRFGNTAVTAAVFAAANVIADIWKALGLIVIAGLLRQRHRLIAALLTVLWTVALAFGVASSIGLYVQDRTALIGGREAQSAALRNFEQELAEEETKKKRLGAAGDVTQIEAAIEALFAKPVTVADRVRGTVGSVSDRCTKVDTRTASDCHRLAVLRADLATAAEITRGEERVLFLRQRLRDLRERGAGDAPDPVAELFAWLSRGMLSVRDIGFGFPVAFGLLIELVSAFGPIGIVTYAASTRPRRADAMASPATPAALGTVAQIEHQPIAAVVDFVAERTLPAAETSAIGAADLHLAYVRWSEDHRGSALDVVAFTAEFDRLRELPSLQGKIRKFGARYFGIAVTASEEGR